MPDPDDVGARVANRGDPKLPHRERGTNDPALGAHDFAEGPIQARYEDVREHAIVSGGCAVRNKVPDDVPRPVLETPGSGAFFDGPAEHRSVEVRRSAGVSARNVQVGDSVLSIHPRRNCTGLSSMCLRHASRSALRGPGATLLGHARRETSGGIAPSGEPSAPPKTVGATGCLGRGLTRRIYAGGSAAGRA